MLPMVAVDMVRNRYSGQDPLVAVMSTYNLVDMYLQQLSSLLSDSRSDCITLEAMVGFSADRYSAPLPGEDAYSWAVHWKVDDVHGTVRHPDPLLII